MFVEVEPDRSRETPGGAKGAALTTLERFLQDTASHRRQDVQMLKAFQKLIREDSTCCLQTSRLAVTLEVVPVVQWHRTEERSNHTATNVENESEKLSREP